MTMKNGDMPATPVDRCNSDAIEAGIQVFSGFTKREMFCLHMGVAETGDAELDAIIHKGNRQKMAAHMMLALMPIYWDMVDDYPDGLSLVKCMSETAVEHADALLAELERTK